MDFIVNDLKILRQIAFCYAMKRGFDRAEAEDFAQEVLLKHTQERRASIRQLFVDYLREVYGSTKVKHGRRGDYKHVSLDQMPWLPADSLDLGAWEWMLQGVSSPMDKLVLSLYFVWGMSQEEIATAAGVSYARIYQLMTKAMKRLEVREKRALQNSSMEASGRGD